MSETKQRHKQRSVTSIDVAKEAGVSRSTVSVVLNNKQNVAISPQTYARVIKAARKLNYRPNVAARAISTRRAYAIGLISCWDPVSPLFARPVQGMLRYLSAQNYGLTLCDVAAARPEAGVETAIEYYQEGRVDGVIFMLKTLGSAGFPSSVAQRLQEAEVPFILINSNTDNPDIDEVSSHNYQVGYLATQHLINLGHRRIAFLLQRKGLNYRVQAEMERLEGYLGAFRDTNTPLVPELILEYNSSSISANTGYECFSRLLRSQQELPSAVYATSDYLAIGALYAAQEAGLKVPEQIAFVGTDNLEMARQVRPALTSVAQPLAQMGEEAAKLLLERITTGEKGKAVKVKLPGSLTIRDSCGAKVALSQQRD
ncbi:MAG TPA: LacI family transcriptional regulator [Firmicutes bacterium]|nr:LacI family transcriptional regulator [Bacillota bacterium]